MRTEPDQGASAPSLPPADGHFRGWVSPAVCERYGIPPDSGAAWEAGGGGAFSFKIDKKGEPWGMGRPCCVPGTMRAWDSHACRLADDAAAAHEAGLD